jgi:YVTN family beta-propeller protein
MISNQPKYWINGILNSTFPVITTAKPGTYNLTLMSWGNFDGYTLAKTTIPIEIIENPELPMPFFVVHLPLKFDLGAKSSTGQSITLAGFTAYDGCGARIPNVPLKVEFIRVDYGKVLQTKDILSDKNGNYSVSSDPIHIGFGQYNVHLTSTYKGLVQSFEAESPITMNYQIPEQGKNPIMQLGNTTQFVKTIPVGITPDAIAVNRVTDKIYVANLNSGTVSIIDGTNNTVRNVKVGVLPGAIAINSKTNMIYVANYGIDPKVNDTVSVIDGWNNAVSTIPVGHYPYAIAVNTVTNKIYVTNYGSGTISVIDGTNNEVNTVKVGGGPIAGAVNSLTIMIYIGNSGIGGLVIDG